MIKRHTFSFVRSRLVMLVWHLTYTPMFGSAAAAADFKAEARSCLSCAWPCRVCMNTGSKSNANGVID